MYDKLLFLLNQNSKRVSNYVLKMKKTLSFIMSCRVVIAPACAISLRKELLVPKQKFHVLREY